MNMTGCRVVLRNSVYYAAYYAVLRSCDSPESIQARFVKPLLARLHADQKTWADGDAPNRFLSEPSFSSGILIATVIDWCRRNGVSHSLIAAVRDLSLPSSIAILDNDLLLGEITVAVRLAPDVSVEDHEQFEHELSTDNGVHVVRSRKRGESTFQYLRRVATELEDCSAYVLVLGSGLVDSSGGVRLLLEEPDFCAVGSGMPLCVLVPEAASEKSLAELTKSPGVDVIRYAEGCVKEVLRSNINRLQQGMEELGGNGAAPSSRSFVQIPASRGTAPVPPSQRVGILHLSDLHWAAAQSSGGAEITQVIDPLIQDLEAANLLPISQVVITGDITEHAMPEEFRIGDRFVRELLRRLELKTERCMILPGNHDVDWSRAVYQWRFKQPMKSLDGKKADACRGFLERDDETYAMRFCNFSDYLYLPIFGKPYSLTPSQQFDVRTFHDDGLQLLGFNSGWQTDQLFPERAGINPQALTMGLHVANEEATPWKRRGLEWPGLVRIAAWHHPVWGRGAMDNGGLEQLQQSRFAMCLHGHVHEEVAALVGYQRSELGLQACGCGTFNAPPEGRPESTPCMYQVIVVERSSARIVVHTRARRWNTGIWTPLKVWGKKQDQGFYQFKIR